MTDETESSVAELRIIGPEPIPPYPSQLTQRTQQHSARMNYESRVSIHLEEIQTTDNISTNCCKVSVKCIKKRKRLS